ncbi:MAG: glycosyltransferase [Bacteroidia bacterium]|nr:glycosyltransferase [Bacteroidia bacterium]MDW8089774.1 glycosyltransferase [Bacteroidia bacterium]
MRFSVIVPVFNRPEELHELLDSLTQQTWRDFEVIVVEDGSTHTAQAVVERFADKLNLRYLKQPNRGPAAARNAGASQSQGEYVIFLDSDCFCPPPYLATLAERLQQEELDGFGGPDTAHPSFTPIQKAISYAMTGYFTTGGLRGRPSYGADKFLPRSFNMGVRREAFFAVGGFEESLRFGEDIDLSLRLRQAGYRLRLIPEAWVYHRRRTHWWAFFKQVYNSGMARWYLTERHPHSLAIIHLLPSAFVGGVGLMVGLALWRWVFLLPLGGIASLWLGEALLRYRYPLPTALLCLWASFLQLSGYGLGFIHAFLQRRILKRPPRHAFLRRFYG